MSKIDEMAEKYADEHSLRNRHHTIVTYTAGAEAVLKEIEKAMKECDIDGSPFVAILDKIKELKQQ